MMETDTLKQVHDLFIGLVKAGFSREEALHMVTAMIVNGVGQ